MKKYRCQAKTKNKRVFLSDQPPQCTHSATKFVFKGAEGKRVCGKHLKVLEKEGWIQYSKNGKEATK